MVKYKERKHKNYLDQKNKSKNLCIVCGLNAINKYCSYVCQHKQTEILIFRKIEDNSFLSDYNVNEYTKGRWFKRYLIFKFGESCMECGWNKINSKTGKIPIELEHIDGNHKNHNISNLKLLCPNCHSLTPTYKGANRGNGRYVRRENYSKGKSF